MKYENVKIGEEYQFFFKVPYGTDEQIKQCKENDGCCVTVVDLEVDDMEYQGVFLVKNEQGHEFVAYGEELYECEISNC